MKKALLAFATVLAIVAGCAKEKLSGSVRTHSGIKVISATIPNSQTKTYLGKDGDIYKFFWYEEEAISVGAGEDFYEFTLDEGADTPKGKFSSYDDLPVAESYYAVSPYMAEAKSNGDTLSIEYTSNLYYSSDTHCATNGEVMVARSSDTTFAFVNAVGYIKFQLQVNTEETLDKITVSGKDGKNIAGPANIIFDGKSIKSIKFSSEASNAINVIFTDAVVATTSEPFEVFIPVAPLPDGVVISVSMKSGKEATYTSSTPVKIGEIVEFPAATFNPSYVAKVGENQYYSFKQAVEAADELGTAATIQLISDCFVGSDCEINSSSEITVDLNGHTLKSVGDNYLVVGRGTEHVIIIDSSAEKTGTITNTNRTATPIRIYGKTTMKSGNVVSGENYGVYVRNGSFFMEGGKISANHNGIYIKPDDDCSVDSVEVKGDALITTTAKSGVIMNSLGSKLVFRGGEVLSQGVGVYVYDGTLLIYDGTFGSKSNVIYANRSNDNHVEIYGGRFHRDSINAIVYCHQNIDSTMICGGLFTNAPSTVYIQEGYFASDCDTTIGGITYKYSIEKAAEYQAEVSINGGTPMQKATINEAFAAATSSDKDAVITLLANCASDSLMVYDKNNKLTVDFNGKTLTINGNKHFKVSGENSDVTFKSSIPGGGVRQASTTYGYYTIEQETGKVTIANGKYETAGKRNNIHNTGGELIINDGEFSADSLAIWVNGKLTVNGGTFSINDTIANKAIYLTTGSTSVFTGGSLHSVYAYSASTSTVFKDGNFSSFILGGANDSITVESGTYQNIHFAPASAGVIKVKGGTFNGRSYMEGAGKLNIEGGTFTNTDGYALYPNAGTVNIKNATFNGNSEYSTLRGIKCIIDIGEGTVVNNSHATGSAIYCGSDGYKCTMTVTGGTFNAPKGFYAADGILSVSGGTFNGCSMRVGYVTSGNTSTEITGGYFNASADSAKFEGKGFAGILKGGWFTKPVTPEAINEAFIQDNTQSTTEGGVTYNYHIVENAANPDIATVNGTGYKSLSSAIAAAKEYSGADGEVTIKLVSPLDTVFIESPTDFTNANGKSVKFDLNNHILNGTVDSLILTKGVLTLTDESSQKGGKITTAKRKIIAIEKQGTVNVKHITIDGTKGAMGYAGGAFSLIWVSGTSSANSAVLNISDGAKLLASQHWVKIVYVTYGTLNTENCEMIAKYGSTSTNGSYPCVWGYTGANINIKSGTYLQANGSNTRGALYVASGNTATNITVEGGAYLYCDGTNGAIGSDASSKEPDVPYCSKTLHLKNGCYLNNYSTTFLSYTKIFDTGESVKEISPAKDYTNCLKETKSFGYQVKK